MAVRGAAIATGLSPRVRGSQRRRSHRRHGPGSIPACAGEPTATGSRLSPARVYPRVCGGAVDVVADHPIDRGLSPRVRGSRIGPAALCRWPRSIPACAGEPYAGHTIRSSRRVYPRVCGGAALGFTTPPAADGLSPRVRGSPHHATNRSSCLGSIPACAGEPRGRDLRSGARRVYPRVCGGAGAVLVGLTATPGLSPRVRGSPLPPGDRLRAAGSIPACAGEPSTWSRVRRSMQVYPRVCGGALNAALDALAAWGLSPRVRGSPVRCPQQQPYSRSIPACAGEPASAGTCRRSGRVYPRVCGGARAVTPAASTCGGLSPRVRGSQLAGLDQHVPVGSIPACAGEPTPPLIRSRCPRVYPRVCGGARRCAPRRRPAQGLSPRVRGSHVAGRHGADAHGSIPACAGEPRRS